MRVTSLVNEKERRLLGLRLQSPMQHRSRSLVWMPRYSGLWLLVAWDTCWYSPHVCPHSLINGNNWQTFSSKMSGLCSPAIFVNPVFRVIIRILGYKKKSIDDAIAPGKDWFCWLGGVRVVRYSPWFSTTDIKVESDTGEYWAVWNTLSLIEGHSCWGPSIKTKSSERERRGYTYSSMTSSWIYMSLLEKESHVCTSETALTITNAWSLLQTE